MGHQMTGYPSMQPWYEPASSADSSRTHSGSSRGDGSATVVQPFFSSIASTIGSPIVMGRAVSSSPWMARIATGRSGGAWTQAAPLMGAPAMEAMARNLSLMLQAAVNDMLPP